MIAGRVFLIAFVACVATSASSNLIEEESRKLAETINDIELVFANTMKQIFWSNKEQAEDLMKNGRELEGKELLNAARAVGLIESVIYAIRHKALVVVRDSISSRLVDRGAVLYDKQSRSEIRPVMLTALVSRVIFRSLIDGDRFAGGNWGRFFRIIEHNLAAFPDNKAFSTLAVDAYQQMLQLNIEAKKARQEFERVLKDALKEMDIDDVQSPHIVDLLDQMIEDVLECRTCGQAEPDPSRLNTRPMFDGAPAILQALSEHVSAEIEQAYTELHGVYDPTPEEQESVTKEDVQRLMQRLNDGL